MTTPAHCTRTWTSTPCYAEQSGIHACSALDSYHHVQHVCVCGNVEPPADVAPDPRLDAIDPVIRSLWQAGTVEHALTWGPRILDTLDAMRPDEMSIYDFVAGEGWTEEQRFTPAPAGLSAAQEIRLEVFRSLVGSRLVGGWTSEELLKATHRFAAEVEHGPDETPEPRPTQWAYDQTVKALEKHRARADLAEARLGHIADALKDLDPKVTTVGFIGAIRDALAWTPDDTATAGAATGDGDG